MPTDFLSELVEKQRQTVALPTVANRGLVTNTAVSCKPRAMF
ncbi:hypothetical protein [Aerosakkonema funiforme]